MDRRIFFEMTGLRLDEDDYPSDEESDEEFDLLLLLKAAFGNVPTSYAEEF